MGSAAAALAGSLLIVLFGKNGFDEYGQEIVDFSGPRVAAGRGLLEKTGGSVKLAKDTDSVAYVIGMNVGLNLQRMDSTINVEAVCEGIRDVFREKTRLSGEEARTFYLGYVNYMLPEKAREYEERFLEDIAKSNRSYARTGSGVTYTVTAVGDQERIPATDRDSVALRCVIRTADGRQLYSSYERATRCATRWAPCAGACARA